MRWCEGPQKAERENSNGRFIQFLALAFQDYL